jgi:hypothetical protein
MTTDKPPVIIIRIKDDPISEKLAKKTRESWERFGHATEFFDAITPNDLGNNRYSYIDFGDEILPHKNKYRDNEIENLELSVEENGAWEPAKAVDGKSYTRVISDTAKCIYYSHIEVWKLVTKRNTPHLVVEHDMVLKHELPENLFDGFYFYHLGESVCHCSYVTPFITNKLLERVNKYGVDETVKLGAGVFESNLLNVDGYMWRLLVNIIYDDHSLQDKMYFFMGSRVLGLSHIDQSNHDLYTDDYGRMILDISKRKDGSVVYETVDHEKLRVS